MTAVEFLHSEYIKIFGELNPSTGKLVEIAYALEQAKELEKEQMTIKKCYHPLTQRKYISDIHFECTICGFYDMV